MDADGSTTWKWDLDGHHTAAHGDWYRDRRPRIDGNTDGVTVAGV